MHRLRALDRWWRLGALAVALLLVAPLLVAVVRATDAGWRPSGASALVALQAIDAASGNPPLEGAPTAPDLPTDPPLRHPGPLQAYLAAAPVHVLGPATGLLVATAAVNAAALLLGAWVVFRRAGPRSGVWAAVLLAALCWALGPVALTDPVGATPGVLPLAALALLAWAVGSGDRTLLPVFALASAVVVQQHLALAGIGVVLTAGGLIGLAQWAWRSRRHRRPRADPAADASIDAWSLGRAWRSDHAHAHVDATLGEGERWWPWVAAAALVGGLCWSPVAYGQLTGQTTALSDLFHAVSAYGGRTVGLGAGLRLALRSLGAPPLLGLTGVTGADLAEPLSGPEAAGALAVVGVLVALVSRTWRSQPALGRLALGALAVAGAGAWTVAQQPAVVEDRLAVQRWAFVASLLAWAAIGWAAARWVAAGRPARAPRRAVPLATAGLVALVAVSLAASTLAEPTRYRDGSVFELEDRVGRAALEAVADDGTVLVLAQGNLAARSLAPAIAAELEAHGHPVVVDATYASSYGRHRTLAQARPDTVILVRSSRAVAPVELAQTTVVHAEDLNQGRRAEYDELAAALATIGPDPLGAEGDALATAAGIEPRFARATVQLGAATPARVLYEPALVDLLARGYLAPSGPSPDALRRLRDRPLRTAWGDDRIDVIELTPGAALYLFEDIRTT